MRLELIGSRFRKRYRVLLREGVDFARARERTLVNGGQHMPSTMRNIETDTPDSTISSRVISLHEAIKLTHSLADTAERIASQLAGNAVAEDKGIKPAAVPNGLYEELGNVIENLNAALYRIDLALGRAGNKLG